MTCSDTSPPVVGASCGAVWLVDKIKALKMLLWLLSFECKLLSFNMFSSLSLFLGGRFNPVPNKKCQTEIGSSPQGGV